MFLESRTYNTIFVWGSSISIHGSFVIYSLENPIRTEYLNSFLSLFETNTETNFHLTLNFNFEQIIFSM